MVYGHQILSKVYVYLCPTSMTETFQDVQIYHGTRSGTIHSYHITLSPEAAVTWGTVTINYFSIGEIS